jgi:hypothetical protein
MGRGPYRILVALCAAVITLSGCTAGDGAENRKNGKDDVKQVSQAEARALVERYAHEVAAAVGTTPTAAGGLRTVANPCEGGGGELSDEVFSMLGSLQLALPEDEQLSTLARVRDRWTAQGYAVTEDRTFPDGRRGTLTVRNPGDGVEIALNSTSEAKALAVMITTPCYRSGEPL